MVDLTDSSSPYQQSIPNLVFYVPAVVVFSLAGKSKKAQTHPFVKADMEEEKKICICVVIL